MKQTSIGKLAAGTILFITVLTVFGFKPNGYTIKGTIASNQGTMFYLNYQYNGKVVKDSAVVSDNQFVLKGTFPEPVICTLTNSVNRQIKMFLAQNAEIAVTGSVEKFLASKVEGSEEDVLYNEFKQQNAVLSSRYRAMVNASGADLHDKTSEPYKVFHASLDSLTTTFIKKHSNTTAAALAIFDCYLTNPDRSNARRCYALLSLKAQQSVYGKRILQFINAVTNISPGHVAPDFELKDIQGKSQKLSDYKGKYILLDFWASWCAPCRAEHPNLKNCYQKYGNSQFQFIGVSMDASQAQWKQAIATDGLTWLQLNDPWSMNGNLAESYGVKAIPFNCIINPKGIIEAVNLRGEALTQYLAAHFKANE
jgi:peroxiredoxin